MIRDRIPARLLTCVLIPNVNDALGRSLGITAANRAVGLLSSDCDDVTYLAMDEATKAANIEVIYARSLYGGAGCASARTAGEVIGILSGPTPSEVESGLQRAAEFLRDGAAFQKADEDGTVVYLAHCVNRTGSYLSNIAGVPAGVPLAYLVAPPVEAVAGLDAALKTADVSLAVFFDPPTETNFGGGLLTGTESACQAACEAFAETVIDLAKNPVK